MAKLTLKVKKIAFKNPQTKKEITIPAATVPAFKAGKAFKDAVNAKKPAKKAKKSNK